MSRIFGSTDQSRAASELRQEDLMKAAVFHGIGDHEAGWLKAKLEPGAVQRAA